MNASPRLHHHNVRKTTTVIARMIKERPLVASVLSTRTDSTSALLTGVNTWGKEVPDSITEALVADNDLETGIVMSNLD
ncbi:hypothetical protein AcW1_007065 [Taiwanofungus camphoratus]|nr:hypothetical protein AcV5_005443 [Antrodia cinnamomea]KAI0925186.1 hypothetical protein AcW2_005866 [Antrodia cinnamomea]KAI0929624.1 hypothetical protein AcV7_005111 [Antrodia cinnamomea]KAI0955501.1 hypothetical protein AcW1_007065 [Antrodia cinnamomea]